MILGFSTGCLYKHLEPVSKEALNLIKLTKCDAVELCATHYEKIYYMDYFSKKDFNPFSYVSLHAPDDFIYRNNKATKNLLDNIKMNYEKFGFKVVVIHPETVADWSVFKKYDLPFAFENVDPGRFGSTVNNLRSVLEELPSARIVVDLLHAYIHNYTINACKNMIKSFKNEIVQVHLSGYKVQDDGQKHSPIHSTRQEEIIKAVPKNVPIIIESVFPKMGRAELINGLKQEYDYVKSILTLF